MHRLGWLVAVLVILQIPYRLVALATPNGLPLGKIFTWTLAYGLVALLTINWLANGNPADTVYTEQNQTLPLSSATCSITR